jgi:hypothetical protein
MVATFVHILMDDCHFGYKQKNSLKNTMFGVLLVTTLPIIILLPGALFQAGPLAISVFFLFVAKFLYLITKTCV